MVSKLISSHGLAPPGLALLAIVLLIKLKQLATNLIKCLDARASHPEVSIVLRGLLDVVKAIALDKVLSVVLVRTQSQQAHCSVKI